MRYLVGVDEAGRGALAGPVAVGVAAVPEDFDWALVDGVADSKLLSPQRREKIFGVAQNLEKEGVLTFRVSMVSAGVIDRVGIARAVATATARALARLPHAPEDVSVKLDGLLTAPRQYKVQETIIKGDQLEPVISLASIAAKVTRDRHMVRLAQRYRDYGFEVHKGYGTRVHQAALRAHGVSEVHRRYFCHID